MRHAAVLLAFVLLVGWPPATAGKGSEGDLVEFSKDHARGEPGADKALVYVLRPSGMGAAVKSWFFCDDEVLGVNRGSSYFFAQVDPGTHVFWSKSENVDAVELEVGAGKTYYIQQQVRMGALKARTKLEILDEDEGEQRLAKCGKFGVLTAAGRERGAEIARESEDRTKEALERRAEKEEEEGD